MPGNLIEPKELLIEAELTARTVSRHQAVLLSAFHDADAVRLELSDPIKMDVCGVQLIESARKFAQLHGKSLTLKTPAGAKVAQLLEQLGLLDGAQPDVRHFWLHEGALA